MINESTSTGSGVLGNLITSLGKACQTGLAKLGGGISAAGQGLTGIVVDPKGTFRDIGKAMDNISAQSLLKNLEQLLYKKELSAADVSKIVDLAATNVAAAWKRDEEAKAKAEAEKAALPEPVFTVKSSLS
jgi:hypothetical protein